MKPVLRAPVAPGSVVIAYIHPGQVSAFFTASLTEMLIYDHNSSRHVVGMMQEWSSTNVSGPRNSLTARFLDEYTAEWLLWIDSDMAWQHTAIDQLLASASKDKAPIVGGLCFGANADGLFPTIYSVMEIDGKLTTVRAAGYPPDAMVQVAATGAAFLLIHRSALTAIRERAFNDVFPFFQETALAGGPAGEDITFCLRAGICGIPVHVNTGVKVGHHKTQLLTEDLYLSQKGTDDD